MASIRRFFHAPARSFFLFGPRGTGKSTWLRDNLTDALRVDLLDPTTARQLLARPERLEHLVDGNPAARVVIIDEIQKAPALLEVVHRLLEARPELSFALTGSSARKLRRGGVNLLGGRAVRRTMPPFLASELGEAFQLDDALRHGLLPLVWSAEDRADTLAGYVTLYLDEEVQAEGLVRRLGDFARFLEVASFSHGALLNTANVARECEVSRKTAEAWFSILEDLLLSWRVNVFARRAQRAIVAHDKWYLFDAGVFRALRPSGTLDRPEEIEGAALEGLVAQHLKAWIDLGSPETSLHFWRTRAGNEVDFVLYGPRTFLALEVKNSARVRPEDLRGLKAFRDEYPESQGALLYRGHDRLAIDGVRCVPVEQFLKALVPGRDPLP